MALVEIAPGSFQKTEHRQIVRVLFREPAPAMPMMADFVGGDTDSQLMDPVPEMEMRATHLIDDARRRFIHLQLVHNADLDQLLDFLAAGYKPYGSEHG